MSEMSDAVADDALASAVAELYALDLGQFAAARDAAAATLRKAGQKAAATTVKKLGRPTVAAWAINQLVRANPVLAQDLAALGVRLRDAQATLDAAALKALRPERDALLDEAVHAAGTVAAARGLALGAAADDEVRGTFVAALADPAAAAAVTSGRLVRPLRYAGFGEVELDDAVAAVPAAARSAPPGPAPRPEPDQATVSIRPAAPDPQEEGRIPPERKQPTRRAEAEPHRRAARERAAAAVAEAERALRDAERQATAASLAEADAHDQRAAAHRRTEEIRTLLAAAERDERAAAEHADAAATEADEARTRVARASAAWEQAKAARDLLPD